MTYYERNLPHWHPAGKAIFITWRLYGSLPRELLISLERQHADSGRQFLAADWMLDAAAAGPRWLSKPQIADFVEDAIRRGAKLGRYTLHAYVVMANHVHILIDPKMPLRRITASIKGVSAHKANEALNRTGKPFWQEESFDHWIRNGAELRKIRNYIELNPVKAGLVARPDLWLWSSAHR